MLIDKRTTTSVSAAPKQQHKLHFPKQNMHCFTKNLEVDSHTLFHFIIAKLKTWRTAFPVSRTPQRISWGRIFNYLSKSVHSPMRKVCQLFSLLPFLPRRGLSTVAENIGRRPLNVSVCSCTLTTLLP